MRSERPFGDGNIIYTDHDNDSGYPHQFKVPYEIEITSCLIVDIIDVNGEPFIMIDICDTEAEPTLNGFATDAAQAIGYDLDVKLVDILVPVNPQTVLYSIVGQDLSDLDAMCEHDLLRFTRILCDVTINWAGFNIEADGHMCLDMDLNEIAANEFIWGEEDFEPPSYDETEGLQHAIMQNSNTVLPDSDYPGLCHVYTDEPHVHCELSIS